MWCQRYLMAGWLTLFALAPIATLHRTMLFSVEIVFLQLTAA
jgi:hypothetical protein